MNITLIVKSRVLFEKVSALHNNLKPEGLMEIQGTQVHSKSAKWLSKRWCRQTASKCLSAFKIGKFVNESQLNAALEARKFIFTKIHKTPLSRFSELLYASTKVSQMRNSTHQGFELTPRFVILDGIKWLYFFTYPPPHALHAATNDLEMKVPNIFSIMVSSANSHLKHH